MMRENFCEIPAYDAFAKSPRELYFRLLFRTGVYRTIPEGEDEQRIKLLTDVLNNRRAVGFMALEAKPIHGDRGPGRSRWRHRALFFMRQCMTACEHLTEVQGCRVETIEYAGVHNGRHVWMART